MQTATDELRDLLRRRAVLALELAACAAATFALWAVSGRIQNASPEVHSIFLTLAVLFGLAVVCLIERLIPVLAFRCPRCDRTFHADLSRATLRLAACAHCGLSAPDGPDRTLHPPR